MRRFPLTLAITLLAITLLSISCRSTSSGLKLEGPKPGIESITGSLPTPQDEGGGWNFTVAPYLWATGITGSAAHDGSATTIDVGFDDLLDHLDFGGAVFVDAQGPGSWGASIDITYMALSAEENLVGPLEAKIELDFALIELDATYAAAEGLDFLAGLRYMSIDSDLEVQPLAEVSQNESFLDPVIGARGRWQLNDKWGYRMRGDLGGFGVGSEFTWQALGAFHYTFTEKLGGGIGYRMIGYEIDEGSTEFDIMLKGLLFGLTYDV